MGYLTVVKLTVAGLLLALDLWMGFSALGMSLMWGGHLVLVRLTVVGLLLTLILGG